MILFIFISLLLSVLVKSELPPALTIKNFDKTVKNDLHFIEFFSPYCSHCKHLAPTWEATYEKFEKESHDLKIYMHQVNCVESGDLCDRESIRYYPALRLYSGDGDHGVFKQSYPVKYKRTENDFIKFLREKRRDVAQELPNKSKHIKTQQLLKTLNGDLQEPILISFWPTKDEQLNEENFDKISKDRKVLEYMLDQCPDCFEMASNWAKISNQLSPIMKTGFVNCFSNKKICESLKLNHLVDVSTGAFKSPVIMAFLPSGNRINYNFAATDIDNVIKWTEKLLDNYQFNETTVPALGKQMDLTRTMGRSPSSDLKLENKVSFIYYYDEETSVPEDFDVLPHVLQHVMDLPFDISVFKSSDAKFKEFALNQEKSLLKYIKYNASEPQEEFDEQMYYMNSITSLPTMLCFKDSSLMTEKFINFEPKEIRNPEKLKKFITKNSIPYLAELTPELYTQYFPTKFDKSIHSKDDKVVITLIDSTSFTQFMQLKLHMSVASHEFNHVQKVKNFEYITGSRANKVSKVNDLRLKDKDTAEAIMQAMRTPIDHSVHKSNTIFTYIDISNPESLKFVKERGWNIDSKSLKAGDTLVISRFNSFYWDRDIFGNQLTIEPYLIRETLKATSFGHNTVKPNLIKSPYGSSFRFMDYVHKHGFTGYLVLLSVVWVSLNVAKRLARIRRARKLTDSRNRGLGILGRVPKND